MTVKWNAESLTRTLFDSKREAMCLVVFSSRYLPSVVFLNQVKSLISDFLGVQLIDIDSEDYRELLNIPALNVTEIPCGFLFSRGRVVCQGLTDVNLLANRLRYLAVQSMEDDDFEPVGTGFAVSDKCRVDHLYGGTSGPSNFRHNVVFSALTPLFTIMDSLYDI